jgi:hypothetical protein
VTLPTALVLAPTRRSRIAFHWRGDRFALNALGGQIATFARATTAAPLDVNGVARTVNHSQPAWEIIDWDGDAVRDTPALLLGTSDSVFYPFDPLPQALTWYLEFVEKGAISVASASVGYIGNAGNTGARLWVDSTGTFYRARHHNGTSEVTSTLAAAPVSGNRVALRVTLDSSGRIQIAQSINQAAESTATQSGTNTLAAAWSGAFLYSNSTGSTNKAALALTRSRIAFGTKTAAQMGALW